MNPTVAPVTDGTPRISRPGEPTWEVTEFFPCQGDWTEEDYLALDTGRLVELSDGRLEVLPMPTLFHQLIVKLLSDRLTAFVASRGLGWVAFAPLPIRLRPGRYREPDVVFLRPERVRDMHGQPDGADLVIEVVSEGEENRERDLRVKRREYAEAAVGEYWIVDPQQRQITVLSMEGDAYRQAGCFGLGQAAVSAAFPEFSVSVDDVFAAGAGT